MRKNKMPDLNDFHAFNSTKGGSDGNTDTTAAIAGGLAGAFTDMMQSLKSGSISLLNAIT